MNDSSTQTSPLYPSKILLALFVCVSILLAAAVLRISLLQPSNNVGWSDAQDYLDMASGPLFTLRFWAGTRPFGVPLVYRLLGADMQRIIYFQFAFAIACWGVLSMAVAMLIRTIWLRPVAFACVLLFSLSRDIVQWDLMILTESITTSFFALLIGVGLLTIEACRAHSPRRGLLLGLLIVTAALWSSTRDTNAYFLLGVAGLLALGLMVRRVRRSPHIRHYLALIAALMAIFVVQSQLAEVYGRWQYPLINVIGRRILVDREHTTFFATHGMPIDRRVMRYKGKFGHAYNSEILRNRNMEPFRQWLSASGKRTYLLFLLSRLWETLAEPLRRADTLLRPALDDYAERAEIAFPAWVGALSTLMYRQPLYILLSAIGAVALLAIVLALLGWAAGNGSSPACCCCWSTRCYCWSGTATRWSQHGTASWSPCRFGWAAGCCCSWPIRCSAPGARRRICYNARRDCGACS